MGIRTAHHLVLKHFQYLIAISALETALQTQLPID